MAAGAADQRYPLRHQGVVSIAIRTNRAQPFLLWRLRSIRRFRPALRRRQVEFAHARPADPLPCPHLWRNQYFALEPRLAPAADGPVRRHAPEIYRVGRAVPARRNNTNTYY